MVWRRQITTRYLWCTMFDSEALCRAVLAAVAPIVQQSEESIAASAFSNACKVFRVTPG